MKKEITKEKLERYLKLTSAATEEAKQNIVKGKEKEANEIIEMVSNYVSDSEYFQEKGDFVNAFAAISYAHGWLDAGVRLGIFDVGDDRLFTVR
jgi:hypothetical protein